MSEESIDILKEEFREASIHSHDFILWPTKWETYSKSHEWHLIKLVDSERDNIPASPGIYTLIVKPNVADHPANSYLMYVGQSTSLRRRFGEYLNKERKPSGRPKIFMFLKMYPNNVWFCFTQVQPSSLNIVESGLRDALFPPLNEQFSGKLSQVMKVLRR